jgi:K+-transporting ATPase A subunit
MITQAGHLDENQAQGGVGAWYDVTLGLTMLVGRFAPIVLALAIVIVGGLIYFPMLILGPIGERITG